MPYANPRKKRKIKQRDKKKAKQAGGAATKPAPRLTVRPFACIVCFFADQEMGAKFKLNLS